ncbi:MAG: isoprenyl transferase [Desulfobacteraceae bacterium]|nr:MAG: isoprenyl transferase [Desulfobacteraceae bacterium]
MDGNGRWAKKRLLNRVKGHEKGAETVRTIVRAAGELGIKVLTLYAFSTENWQRPAGEIKALMALLKKFLIKEEPDLLKNNIRLGTIGQLARLPDDARATIEQVKTTTAKNDGLLLNLALSYGGRTEIVEMVQAIAAKTAAGALTPEHIDEKTVTDHLYTSGLPDPDLMIRTSGEMRISNFLLWQLAYSELYITPTLWPDFTSEEFIGIIREYQQRERRFGKVDPA